MSHTTYPSDNTRGFASILYVVFVLEKKFSVKEIAPQLDISPSSLYGYIEGQRVFPPDLIAPLYLATRERRFLSFFLDEAGVIFHDAPVCDDPVDLAMLEHMLTVQERVLHVLQHAVEGLRDGRFDRREVADMEPNIWEAHAELAKFLACAKHQARCGKG